jgi:tripartite-type tricarboxylate transporter receptor subunit TctC
MKFKTWIATAIAAGIAMAASTAQAQAWPTKPVRIVVGYAPGGVTDQVARIVGQRLAKDLGQPVVVDNRAGAGGTLAADLVAKSAGDGHTLLFGEPGGVTINASLMKLPFDPQKDLVGVAQVVSLPMVLVASTSSKIKTLKDVLAQSGSQTLPYGTPGNGTIQHLTMTEFAKVSHAKLVHAAYKGGAPVVVDVLGGHVPLGMVTIPTVLPQIQAGTVVPVAVVSRKRSALVPQVATFSESGFKLEQDIWQGFLAPASTPGPVIEAMSRAIQKAAQTPEVEKALTELGVPLALSNSADFQKHLQQEFGHWARIVKESGLPRE